MSDSLALRLTHGKANPIEGKHVVFDSDALIDIAEFDLQDIIRKFISENRITPCITNPVILEISKTNNSNQLEILKKVIGSANGFFELPLTQSVIKNAAIMINLIRNCKGASPSVTDLYLGTQIAVTNRGRETPSIFLLTGNVSDYPYPYFVNVGSVFIQSERINKTKHLSLLCFNRDYADELI